MRIWNILTAADLKSTLKYFQFNHFKGRFVKQEDGSTLVYTQELCDHCGKPCQGANPIIYDKVTDIMLFRGIEFMTEDQYEAPEMCATDNGDAVCPDCYKKVQE
jgi:hypothetical protein